MKRLILIGIIIIYFILVGVNSFIEWRYWYPFRFTPETAEKLFLTEGEAKNVLETYAQQYLKKMDLDWNIEKIVLKPEESYGTTPQVLMEQRHPKKPWKLIDVASYSGEIIFSKDTQQGTLKVDYYATALYNLKDVFLRDFWDLCIKEDKECVLHQIGSRVLCENKIRKQATPSGDVSKYFNCVCKQTTTSTPPLRNCSLNFSARIESSPDNKAIVIIDTPNYIPELVIKGEKCKIPEACRFCEEKCSHVIKDLQPGTIEKITDCDFDKNICIKLLYKEYQIAELNYQYLR